MQPVSGQPENQRYYASESLRTAQARLMELSQQLAVQRAQVERCRARDIHEARDAYAALQQTRQELVGILSDARFLLLEVEAEELAAAAGQLQTGLAGFNLMSRAYRRDFLVGYRAVRPLCLDGQRIPPGRYPDDGVIVVIFVHRGCHHAASSLFCCRA